MVNQIFLAPGELQEEVVTYCREHDVLLEAYSPLGTGKIFDVPEMKALAEKHQKSIAQLHYAGLYNMVSCHYQNQSHQVGSKENIHVFDFELSEEDMKTIDQLDGVVGKATIQIRQGFNFTLYKGEAYEKN